MDVQDMSVDDLFRLIRICQNRIDEIREKCEHKEYELDLRSDSRNHVKAARECKYCRLQLDGITKEEELIVKEKYPKVLWWLN